jgi:transcriptional regulator GlxA family with amidase domain
MSGSNRVVCRQQLTCAPANWVAGVRYVDDGRFISSAGVTSGVDVSLDTVQRFLGRDAALETAQRVGYPHTELLDDRIARNAAR